MTAREGRRGKRKDGMPKGVNPFVAFGEGAAAARKRQYDRIELKALRRTPPGAERVTLRVQLASDMTRMADRGWTVSAMSNRGLYNLNTVWVMQIERAVLEGRYATEQAEAVHEDGQGHLGD